MEAISHAGICVGILAKDGIVLAVEKKITSKLLENISSEKMYKVRLLVTFVLEFAVFDKIRYLVTKHALSESQDAGGRSFGLCCCWHHCGCEHPHQFWYHDATSFLLTNGFCTGCTDHSNFVQLD
jgi:hypothetical protein